MTYRRYCENCGKYWVSTGMDNDNWKYIYSVPKFPDKTDKTICPNCITGWNKVEEEEH